MPWYLTCEKTASRAATTSAKPRGSASHGGPLRLVVPKQLGYKSVKWVTRIEVTDKPVQGYWGQRGYPSNAPV